MRPAPPVVLLHGWGGGYASIWAAHGWPAAIEGAGRLICPIDLPGHGGPASPDPTDYRDLAGLVAAGLPEGPIDLVGFSLGGKLALAIAARWPGRVRRLVVGGVGDNLFSPEPSGEAVARALTGGVPEDAPPIVGALVRYAAAGNDPAALAAVLRRPPNPMLAEADLADVADVLLVNGDADAIATPDARLREALPRCRAVRLPGVDHLSLPAAPAFRDLALQHLTNETPSAEDTHEDRYYLAR